MSKKILGRHDVVDFPKLGLFNIDVKMDTGAYTSAIHCSDIIEENDTLRCIFNSHSHENFGKTEIVFDQFWRTNVKSSNGNKENRYKVKSDVVFFGKTYRINLTLSTRSDMKFPVLIGRQFLKQKFMVDVDLENVSFKLKK
ncbi:ATP-dependent zinc protease [Algibacter miyuki]|uniref:ATP-dependent zinc protease n=1 Tax=Algibacter miyuki TaxID=1306933 RepID=A0ABV5GUV9_9FLAO|nr:RimK/LysX family protein [Algibacter miyuki]MDN3664740.1 RimK/LysX family protein [Algibacter miyuki]